MGTRSKSYGCPMWEAYPGVTSLLLVKFSTHPCRLLPSSYSDRSSYISFSLSYPTAFFTILLCSEWWCLPHQRSHAISKKPC